MRNTVGMVSLGCAKNRVDSEVALGLLRQKGYRIIDDPSKAEIIFVNTCGFIESAKEESIETIFEMANYKKTGVLKKLFVTGCLAQRYARELEAEMPEVDGFLGVYDYEHLFDMMDRANRGERPCYMENGERFLKADRVLTTEPYRAYVKIAEGCDNCCAYCAIPMIRGRYVSRTMDDILQECRTLIAGGVTELTLVAQDTSRYGVDLNGGKPMLRELLEAVAALEGVHWVRVLYCYPDMVDDALLDTIAGNPKICSYMDLPLQHISAEVLRRMNRKGTPDDIRRVLDGCKKRGIVIRTTMMVGFPGETQAQFEELVQFVGKQRFDRLGAFAFSSEEGTMAASMPDPVDEAEKARRLDELMILQQGISMELNAMRAGSNCEILIEGRDETHYLARSQYEAPESDGLVRVTPDRELSPGQYVKARMIGCDAYDLYAEVIE